MTLTATPTQVPATPPPAAKRARGAITWIVIVVALVVAAGFGVVLSGIGQWAERGMLDPESAGPTGTRAIVEILRDHGVDVTVARDRATAARELTEGPATLVLPDAPALSDEAIEELADAASDVVLVDPRSRTLRLAFVGAGPAGAAGADPIEPRCDLPDAQRAGPVAPGAVFLAGDAAEACYPSGEGFGLLSGPHADGGRISAVDARALFTNEHLAADGNAALAANLMGRHPHLVWYMPSPADSDLADANPSLGELTPPWVSPVIVLLIIAGVAAAIWRGRRFGPLVTERLPVTVRASETTEGRARLYAQSRNAVHALDQLRIGALERLSHLLGLGRAASAPEICDAAAARAGVDRAIVRGILIDQIPADDAELVALAQRIRQLEHAVRAAVRPERNKQ